MNLERAFLKYFEIAKINFKNVYAYPVQMLISAPIFLLHVFLFYALYSATYAVTNAKSLSGFSLSQTIWLLVLTYICDSTYGGKWSRIIDEEVRSGTLAYSLNRPFSYVLYHYSAMLGSSLPKFFINLALGATATLWLVGPLSLSGLQIGVCLVSIVGGCTLNFLINFCIGLGALWLEDTEGIVWIVTKSRRVLGGHMIPLYFLPSTMKMIAESLPFSMISYGPSLLMVSFTHELCYKVFMIQGIWIAIMGMFAFFLFKRGIRNVSINGG